MSYENSKSELYKLFINDTHIVIKIAWDREAEYLLSSLFYLRLLLLFLLLLLFSYCFGKINSSSRNHRASCQ